MPGNQTSKIRRANRKRVKRQQKAKAHVQEKKSINNFLMGSGMFGAGRKK